MEMCVGKQQCNIVLDGPAPADVDDAEPLTRAQATLLKISLQQVGLGIQSVLNGVGEHRSFEQLAQFRAVFRIADDVRFLQTQRVEQFRELPDIQAQGGE
ncbi:hypothetical protein D3C77_362690 [compost metagenome]